MKNKKIIAGVVFAVLLLTIPLGIGYTLAKYFKVQGQQSDISSDVFYFSSDFLSDDEENPQFYIYGQQVTFVVRNYLDSLRINESDIDYTVTATAGTITDESGGTLVGNAQNENAITLSYTLGEDELQKKITVTAESGSPYAKTLQAKFVFIKSDSEYEIIDSAESYYAELNIYTGDSEQDVTIQWDNTKIFIDETNDYVFGGLSQDKNSLVIQNIAADTTVRILFFKNDITQDYSCAKTGFSGTITITTTTA